MASEPRTRPDLTRPFLPGEEAAQIMAGGPPPRRPWRTLLIGAGVLALAAALVIAFLLNGNKSKPTPVRPPAVKQSTTPKAPTTPPAEAAAAAAAFTAYTKFRAAADGANIAGVYHEAEVRKWAGDPAVGDAVRTFYFNRRLGILQTGRTTVVGPGRVIKVNLAAQPPQVTFQACVDNSNVKLTSKATGKSALAPGHSPRLLIDVLARQYQGRWLVIDAKARQGTTC